MFLMGDSIGAEISQMALPGYATGPPSIIVRFPLASHQPSVRAAPACPGRFHNWSATARNACSREFAEATRLRTSNVPGTTGYLWYEEGPGLRAAKVTTGLTDGGNVEVSAPGLSAGKTVITSETKGS